MDIDDIDMGVDVPSLEEFEVKTYEPNDEEFRHVIKRRLSSKEVFDKPLNLENPQAKREMPYDISVNKIAAEPRQTRMQRIRRYYNIYDDY